MERILSFEPLNHAYNESTLQSLNTGFLSSHLHLGAKEPNYDGAALPTGLPFYLLGESALGEVLQCRMKRWGGNISHELIELMGDKWPMGGPRLPLVKALITVGLRKSQRYEGESFWSYQMLHQSVIVGKAKVKGKETSLEPTGSLSQTSARHSSRGCCGLKLFGLWCLRTWLW